MAIFNYAKTYEEVSSYVGKTSDNLSDFVKFIITGDGHIISHGVDFIPWTNKANGKRYLSAEYLPVTDSENPSDTTFWTSQTTKTLLDSVLKTLQDKINAMQTDSMQFRGTISTGTASGKYSINGGADLDFPSSDAKVGDTYRVVKAGTYAGSVCEVGDLLICTALPAKLGEQASWTVAQANINGVVQHSVNGNAYSVYSSNTSAAFSVYAPTTAGTAGQVVSSTGGVPSWVTPTFTYTSADDTITLTIGSFSKTITIDNRRAINVNGVEKLAKTVATALDLCNGSGVNVAFANNKATFSVGSSYTTNAASKLFAVSVDTKSNSLYVDLSKYPTVSSTASGLAPAVAKETTNVTNAFYVLASSDGTTAPSWYKLPATAFKDTWRDVLVNGTSIGAEATLNLKAGDKISLANTSGTVTISSSWREIQVGGTSIEDKKLNFMPTGDIYVKTADMNAGTEDTFDVGFGIAWYNMSTKEYEYA